MYLKYKGFSQIFIGEVIDQSFGPFMVSFGRESAKNKVIEEMRIGSVF